MLGALLNGPSSMGTAQTPPFSQTLGRGRQGKRGMHMCSGCWGRDMQRQHTLQQWTGLAATTNFHHSHANPLLQGMVPAAQAFTTQLPVST